MKNMRNHRNKKHKSSLNFSITLIYQFFFNLLEYFQFGRFGRVCQFLSEIPYREKQEHFFLVTSYLAIELFCFVLFHNLRTLNMVVSNVLYVLCFCLLSRLLYFGLIWKDNHRSPYVGFHEDKICHKM